MQFLEKWIEHDYNPFIIFDANGKVKSLNQEAQYLLGEVSTKEIFDIAGAYAAITYGFKTTILDLEFGSYRFYGITVGYESEEEIGVKLYKYATQKFSTIAEYGEPVNIYTLLDLCISATSTGQNTQFKKEFDPTFPDLRLQIDGFTKLLNKTYASFQHAPKITTKLSLKTGEHIRFKEKKYPIFTILVEGEGRDRRFELDAQAIAKTINCIVHFKEEQIIITSPLISA
ncbi:hypothetical protein JWV37_08295 [Sulfurospirillum sp. T05]|uniref:PAS domain-containing protein n=1 Tax=Sulfurospirillum tamanense TaxID=2813362 RepID=A0ABS2WUB4_9BACT|nr:hypothetical protein [Sulfurospirillum tamanensis]MBN2964779.1 hypothetical protein [Sulfurospirillum tamanensis]